MLMVVYGHVGSELHPGICSSQRVIWLFSLPLFFFIYGFFSTSSLQNGRTISYFQKLSSKLKYQFVPTICMWLLFLVIFGVSVKESLLQETKSGFWFVYVAIQYYLVYMLYYILIEYRFKSKYIHATFVIGICFTSQLLLGFLNNIQSEFLQILSAHNFLTYLPFFFLGVLCKRGNDKFNQLISNKIISGALLVIFIGIFFIPTNMSFMGKLGGVVNIFIYLLQRICGLLILFRTFQYYSSTFSRATRVGRVLIFIGQYTLEIYLVHMFILLSLGLSGVTGLYGWDIINKIWAVQIIIYGSISLFICGCCLLIARILRLTTPLYLLFLGRYEKSI